MIHVLACRMEDGRLRLRILHCLFAVLKMGAKFVSPRTKCPVLLLMAILLFLMDLAGASIANALQVRLEPTQISDLKAGHNRTVNVAVIVEKHALALPKYAEKASNQWAVRIEVDSVDESTAEAEGDAISHALLDLASLSTDKHQLLLNLVSNVNTSDDDVLVGEGSFVVRGNFIGKTHVNVYVTVVDLNTNEPLDHPDPASGAALYQYSVSILRGSRTLNAIFVSTLGCLIIMANVLMGCNMNMDVVYKVLKTPIAPAIGLSCQFLLMPLLAYGLAHLFLVPAGMYSLALGLYTSGCVPGGGASNFWTVLLEGNSDLSITMTFMSTVAALVMMPLWMMLLGPSLLESSSTEIHIPYKHIVISLLCLVVPLLVGLALSRWLPKVATVGRKVLRPFLIFILVFIVVFGSYANWYMFHFMNWRVLTSGLLLPWCGFMFGCFCALLFRQAPANVAAIAIETGIQNSGVAIMLLKVSFAQPEADMASVIPVVVSIFTPVPLLMGWAVHKVMHKFKGDDKQQILAEDDHMNDKEMPLIPAHLSDDPKRQELV